MFMKHYAPNRCQPSIEALNFRGGGRGDQGKCERRSEVFVKIPPPPPPPNFFFFFLGGGGVMADVNREVKFFFGGESGWGGGGGSGWM